jgi:hypothetical protein
MSSASNHAINKNLHTEHVAGMKNCSRSLEELPKSHLFNEYFQLFKHTYKAIKLHRYLMRPTLTTDICTESHQLWASEEGRKSDCVRHLHFCKNISYKHFHCCNESEQIHDPNFIARDAFQSINLFSPCFFSVKILNLILVSSTL